MNERVMVAGHICLDVTPVFPNGLVGGFSDILAPGKLVNVEHAVLGTGGAVANTGQAMARLGADVQLNGKVGADPFGEIVKQLVGPQRARSFSTVEGESTSYSVVLAPPGVDRVFLHFTGTNDSFGADDIDYEGAKGCRLFHFGYPPLMRRIFENGGAELVEIYHRMKGQGVMTSLDMTLPDPASDSGQVDWASLLGEVLKLVDVFTPSVEEIAYMLDRELFEDRKAAAAGGDAVELYTAEDVGRLSGQLLEMGVKVAAIKCGIRGYYLRTAGASLVGEMGLAGSAWADRELWAPSFRAETFASATGAGDATIAGFLCALLRGFEPETSLRIANTVGWENVRQMDALSGIEDWETTLQLAMDESRVTNPLELHDAGWKAGSAGVWRGPHDKL